MVLGWSGMFDGFARSEKDSSREDSIESLPHLLCVTNLMVHGHTILRATQFFEFLATIAVDAWARRLFAATGDRRAVVSDAHALYFGIELRGGELTPGHGARIGATDFDTWFETCQS
jgi:hypothetical protein